MALAPGLSGPARITWDQALKDYARAANAQSSTEVAAERVRLVNAVLISPTSASAWNGFFDYDSAHGPDGGAAQETRQGAMLGLLRWATELVQRPHAAGDAGAGEYVRLWLRLAREAERGSAEDARDTYKMLRRQRLAEGNAELYMAWAGLEERCSGPAQALDVVRKGLREGAQPAGPLNALAASLEAHLERHERKGEASVMGDNAVLGATPLPERCGIGIAATPLLARTPIGPEDDTRTLPLRRRLGTGMSKAPSRPAMAQDTPGVHMAGGEVSASRSLSTSTASTRSSAPASEGRAAAFSDTPAASGRAQDASHPASSAQQPPPSARRPGPQRLGFGAGARAQRVAPLAPSSTASPPRSGQDAVAPTPGAEHSRAMGAVAPGTAANGADGACKGALECPRTAGPRTGGVAGSCTVGNDATAATATRRVAHERSGGRVPLAEVPQGQGGQAARADGGAIKGGGAAGGAGEREGARRGSGAEAGAHPGREEPSVLVNGVRYRVLERVGRGGSCRVYKVVAPNNKILALKRIELDGREQEVAQGFLDEITLLRRLKGTPHIIQLVDHQVLPKEGLIYVLLEFGETDLARLLHKQERVRQERGLSGWDENFVRLYWEQMLHAVHSIHEARIVHSDLKPANFLVVEGQLKLIDFGIAKAISQDTTSIARESTVGTLNYMSPEAIMGGREGTKVGRPSDVWSLGCILYQMVFGRTPFAHLAFVPKMHAITDPRAPIEFPECVNADCVDAMRRCLDRNPRTRATIPELLDHAFLHPGRRSAPSEPALTKSQLQVLLGQMCQAQGKAADPETLSAMADTVMQQLQRGEALNLMQFFQ